MLFSIIVPIFKVEKYIRECVDSILAQTFPDFELILVDDGSPDGSAAICDEYAKQDDRVIVVHKVNGGATSARKEGFKISKGEYLLAVDGDDYLSCDTLKEISNILNSNDYDLICFGYDTFPYLHRNVSINYREGEYNKVQIENEIYPSLITGINGKRFPPSIWGKVFKRELVVPVQNALPNEIIIGEDSCISYVSIYLAKSMYIMHNSFYYYRVDNQSLTRGLKKSFSWYEPFMRADFYLKYMPKEKFGDQIARITAHSLFNVAISVIKTKQYSVAKREIKEKLSENSVQQVLLNTKFKKNIKERIALYCLKHKNTFLMRLLAKVV